MNKVNLNEAGYEYSVVRSVKYDPDCYCPRKGEIPFWAIAIAILVVLIVAVAIFFVYRKRRPSGERKAVATNDGV